MKKLNSNLYVTETIKYYPKERTCRYASLPDDFLYAGHNGNYYPTKIKKEDLPEWYVYGRYYKRFGYLNCKGIKYIKYRPCRINENHVLRDDWLLISYESPIMLKEGSWGIDGYVYDEAVVGNEIIDVLKAMRDYDGWNIDSVVEEIWQKILTLKFVPSCFADNYYDEIKMSREVFNDWWK